MAPKAQAAACSEEISRLQSAITDMDALSQEGFSEIAAIARLTLRAMEAPSTTTRDNEDIAQALRTIWGKADDIQNCINCEAENVGCNWMSEASKRRWAAIQEAQA